MNPTINSFLAGRRKVLLAILVVAAVSVPVVQGLQPYLWNTSSSPLSAGEPLAVVQFPPNLNMFAGENMSIPIVVTNSASVSITAFMVPMIGNAQLEQTFITYGNANDTFVLAPGINTVYLTLTVSSVAPPISDTLQVYFYRI